MKFEDLKFMSIGGNCACIGYLGDERIRGPVDNVITMDYICIKMLLEKTYYSDIIKYSKTVKKVNKRKIWETDSPYFYQYKHVWIAHHNPATDKYKTELKIRTDRFNDFYNKVLTDNNYYFVLNLNEFDVDKKTHHLRKNNKFIDILNYLKKQNLLQKTFIIGTRLDENKTDASWDYWCYEMPELIKKYNLKYIEIRNLSIWHTEDSHKQFLEQVRKELANE